MWRKSLWLGVLGCFLISGLVVAGEPVEDEPQQQAPPAAQDRMLRALREAHESAKKRREASIPTMSLAALCEIYGELTRGEVSQELAPAITQALKAKGLAPNKAKALKKTFSIGDGACQMYAALGRPEHANRTVTSRGERIQHVFGNRVYVYTVDGRVTAWQD